MDSKETCRSVEPSAERIRRFVAGADDAGPIVMINLLRYRERAAYESETAATPCSGREAYARYAEVAVAKVGEVGGRILWLGEALATVIAPDGEEWDEAVLVEYPSRQAFLRMVAMPDYLAAAVHRTAALADSRLIATMPKLGGLAGQAAQQS